MDSKMVLDVQTWFERDRACVRVLQNGKEIACWWDDDVQSLAEDGFLVLGKGLAKLEQSAIDYCKHVGVLK